jgi:hypothetical protein
LGGKYKSTKKFGKSEEMQSLYCLVFAEGAGEVDFKGKLLEYHLSGVDIHRTT